MNDKLRKYLKDNDVYIWQVADELGIHESTLVKKLRRELTEEMEQNIYLVIEQILLTSK